MRLEILKEDQATDCNFVGRIIESDKLNMNLVLEAGGIEFPEEKRRKIFQEQFNIYCRYR